MKFPGSLTTCQFSDCFKSPREPSEAIENGLNVKSILGRFTPTRIFAIVMPILLVFVPLNVYWNMDRINRFYQWNTGYSDAQLFDFYGMEPAALQVNSTNFSSNTTTQNWYRQQLDSAFFELDLLSRTDSNLVHKTHIFYMDEALDALGVNMTWTTGLTGNQRSTLSKILLSVGNDILYAYTAYGDFSNSNNWSLFWYSGPVPPDENLFNQAYISITTLPGLPSLGTF